MSDRKDGLDERSILIIENLIWAYENCNIADNKLIRDFIDCGINHIKTQAKENAELIEKNDKLESESVRLKAECDAAVEALGTMTYPNCSGCIDEGDMTERCINCDRNPDTKHIGEDHWEWICPEYALIKTNGMGKECPINEAYKRLAAYEDTGKTPEEVAALVKAESEGRLVELPVAIGGKVYTINDTFDQCTRCDFAKKHHFHYYRDCLEYCREHKVTGYICPETKYEIQEHKVEGYEIIGKNILEVSDAVECCYEGLGHFCSDGGFDTYTSYEAAEAALREVEK